MLCYHLLEATPRSWINTHLTQHHISLSYTVYLFIVYLTSVRLINLTSLREEPRNGGLCGDTPGQSPENDGRIFYSPAGGGITPITKLH